MLYLLFFLPALLFAMWAQMRVRSTYAKFSKVPNAQGLTGMDVARMLTRNEGLDQVRIEEIPGNLTDHYDPRGKVMRLSQGSIRAPSVAALAIVAHELGHAVQDQQGYAWLRVRVGLVGVANIGSQFGLLLVIVGLIMGAMSPLGTSIAWAGIILFSVAVAFTLVTLPVEFNASNRAREMLTRNGLVTTQDAQGVNQLLNAAALTYVAAAAQAISQLFYFLLLLTGRRS
jgi:uncharacterized protein